MKFTLSWLKDHLETDASAEAIGAKLTELGLELEGIEDPSTRLAPVVIAHVLEAVQHPNADKLRICTVDVGGDAPVQVVCGAPNARAGMKAAFAPPGAYIPGSGITLKVAPIRGVESHGMLCSARELELGEDHDGILDLDADAPVGASFARWLGLDDPVFDIALTPDRQDCLGVWGIARDLAAAGLGRLVTPTVEPVGGRFPCPVAIRIDDPDGCLAFYGRVVRGVSNGASPAWLQRRLKAIGLRAISALVDVTQYIMIDRGRPLHVYDLAKLTGAVTARRGQDGEILDALNGKTYPLSSAMTVIADEARVLGLGGIMGGQYSGCDETTTDVLIECALFDPVRIGETGRALNLTSDARTRFERGVDPAFVATGIELATRMALDLCGGAASDVASAGAVPRFERRIAYRPSRVATLGGLDVSSERQQAILERLGFGVGEAGPPHPRPLPQAGGGADVVKPLPVAGRELDATKPLPLAGGVGVGLRTEEGPVHWSVTVPSWRKDVEGEADLVEEVLRLVGYDHIPPAPMDRREGVARPTATRAQARLKRVRRALAARGYCEAITWSFVAPADAAPFGGGAWTLDNPISADLAVMRPSLLPGLIRAAARNRDRGAASVRLFEIGQRYLSVEDGFERQTAALIATGEASPRHWRSGKAGRFDAFDAKAEALAILDAAGFGAERAQVTGDAPAWFHPGRSGVVRLGPTQPLAAFGALHPRVVRQLGLDDDAIGVEVFLDAVPLARIAGRTRGPFAPPALQAVTRDFAFLVADDTPAAKLVAAIRNADKLAIQAVEVFDVFTGAGVEPGQKSVAVAVILQPREASFTEEQLNALSARIVAAAQKATGARLRG